MTLLSKLFWWRNTGNEEQTPAAADPPVKATVVELPEEAYVFECQACGKVFEARRRRPLCPECDSPDVSLMSE